MFNLELDNIVKRINEKNFKRVLIQLPDGLKNKSNEIVEYLESKTPASVFIWVANCFGACDIPLGLNSIKIDLLVQFGHNSYNKTKEW